MRHVPRGFIIKMHWRVSPVHKLSGPIIDPASRWMGDGIYVEYYWIHSKATSETQSRISGRFYSNHVDKHDVDLIPVLVLI